MTASNPATDRISRLEDAIRLILNRELPETLTLSHLALEDRTNHDGDSYLHTYIVFEGDREKIDPAWTITLPRKDLGNIQRDGIRRNPNKLLRPKGGMEGTPRRTEITFHGQ